MADKPSHSDFNQKRKRVYYSNKDVLDSLPKKRTNKVEECNRDRKLMLFDDTGMTKMDPFKKRQCLVNLRRLMVHPDGWPFKLNDRRTLHEIISKPGQPLMNFETVKGKLEKGLYESTDQFARDVRILFSNAKVFYPMNHGIHRIAMKLSALFETKWKSLEETWEAEKEKEKPQPKPKPKENVTKATGKKRKASSDAESLAKEANGNLQIKKERETARMIVDQIQRTIFIDDGLKSFEELEQLCGHSLENHCNMESPLKQILGLVLKT